MALNVQEDQQNDDFLKTPLISFNENMPHYKTKDYVCYTKPHFKEADEILTSLQTFNVTKPFNDAWDKFDELHRIIEFEDKCLNSITIILKQYLEQPGLLDPAMPIMMNYLLQPLEQKLLILQSVYGFKLYHIINNPNELRLIRDLGLLCSVVYTLCIIQHPQAALRHFITDTHCLPLILNSIEALLSSDSKNALTMHYALSRHDIEKEAISDDMKKITCNPVITEAPWKCLYTLLLWLSLLILSPFELSSFTTRTCNFNLSDQHHSIATTTTTRSDIEERIFLILQSTLKFPAALQHAAALLGSRLFRRPDIYQSSNKTPHSFLAWARMAFPSPTERYQNTLTEATLQIGILRCLKCILKAGDRSILAQFIPSITVLLLDNVTQNELITVMSQPKKKFYLAAIGRLGLYLTLPYLSTWRYKKKKKMLMPCNNLIEQFEDLNDSNDCQYTLNEIIVEGERLDDVVDILLESLGDQGTLIRWTSAKSIARICERLSKDMADQLLAAILEIFNQAEGKGGENEKLWNGSCLTIAELIRRGCVLPSMLQSVIPVLLQAVQYEPTGPSASRIAAATRDAGCFICWSMARTYPPELLESYVYDITSTLINVALFDRNVNCRRSASAALQEFVGRLGIVPHGIPLVTIADYFGLATLRSSYLKAAPQIAQFEIYQPSILNKLINFKLRSTDRSIRELAAHSLRLAAESIPIMTLIPLIIELKTHSVSTSITTEGRHGALLGLASLIDVITLRYEKLKLSTESTAVTTSREPGFDALSDKLIFEIRNIVLELEKQRLYRGRGGELTRESVCRLLLSIAQASSWIPFKENTSQRYMKTIYDCLRHFVQHVQLAAVDAFRAIIKHRATENLETEWFNKLWNGLKDSTEHVAARRGYLLGLRGMRYENDYYAEKLNQLLDDVAREACCFAPNGIQDLSDPETRQAALTVLPVLLEAIGKTKCSIDLQRKAETYCCAYHKINWDLLCDSLETASVDYTFDRRGDIGSWVRDTAIEAATYILDSSNYLMLLQPSITLRLFNIMLRQVVDKLDRVRGRAAFLIHYLLLRSIQPTKYYSFHINWSYQRVYYSYPYEFVTTSENLLTFESLQKQLFYFCQHHNHNIKAGNGTSTYDYQTVTPYFDTQHNITKHNGDALFSELSGLGSLIALPWFLTLITAFNAVLYLDNENDTNQTEKQSKTPNFSAACLESNSKGLGVQSSLAWGNGNILTNTTTVKSKMNIEEKQNIEEEKEEEKNEDLLSTSSDNTFQKNCNDFDTFISWNPYSYATQRFQKFGTTLKLVAYNDASAIFKAITPLILLPQYRWSILSGIVNAAGVSVGQAASSAISPLISLLQDNDCFCEAIQKIHYNSNFSNNILSDTSYDNTSKKCHTSLIPALRKALSLLITHSATIVSLHEQQQQQQHMINYPIIETTLNTQQSEIFECYNYLDLNNILPLEVLLRYFKGIPIISLFKFIARLLSAEVGCFYTASALLPFLSNVIETWKDVAILRSAIDIVCCLATFPEDYYYNNNNVSRNTEVYEIDETLLSKPSTTISNNNNTSSSFSTIYKIQRSALNCCLKAIGHRFPCIRQHAAETFYSRLLICTASNKGFFSHQLNNDLDIDAVLEFLLLTSWGSCPTDNQNNDNLNVSFLNESILHLRNLLKI